MIMLTLLVVVVLVLTMGAIYFLFADNNYGFACCVIAALVVSIVWPSSSDDPDKLRVQGICLDHRAYPGCDAVIKEMQQQDEKAAAKEASADQAAVLDYLKGKQR